MFCVAVWSAIVLTYELSDGCYSTVVSWTHALQCTD